MPSSFIVSIYNASYAEFTTRRIDERIEGRSVFAQILHRGRTPKQTVAHLLAHLLAVLISRTLEGRVRIDQPLRGDHSDSTSCPPHFNFEPHRKFDCISRSLVSCGIGAAVWRVGSERMHRIFIRVCSVDRVEEHFSFDLRKSSALVVTAANNPTHNCTEKRGR